MAGESIDQRGRPPFSPPEIGTAVELDIADVAYRGAGISRTLGMVAFVPGTLPGERVVARISGIRKNFILAELAEVLTPSPDRIPDQCLLSDGMPVPGCAYGFVRHCAEVSLKEKQLRDFLRDLASPSTVFLQPFASPSPLHYRNKATFHVGPSADSGQGTAIAGYFGDDNRTIIDVQECPLADGEINEVWRDIGAKLRSAPPRCGSVTLRHTDADGVVSWTDAAPPEPGRRLVERSPVGDLLVPCDGFYQVNPGVSGALVEQVSAWTERIARENGVSFALDLFCGVGVFAFAAARSGIPRAMGVESSRPSVKCARANAERLSMPKAEFHCRDVSRFLAKEAKSLPLANAVAIADPPRMGIPRPALDAICASPVRHAIFVSCDPATLARDLKVASAAGFRLREVRLFDMFPRTIHFESAVLLERQ